MFKHFCKTQFDIRVPSLIFQLQITESLQIITFVKVILVHNSYTQMTLLGDGDIPVLSKRSATIVSGNLPKYCNRFLLGIFMKCILLCRSSSISFLCYWLKKVNSTLNYIFQCYLSIYHFHFE